MVLVSQFQIGDRVRVDIPDQTDHDYERYHGRHGTVVDLLEDEAGKQTGDRRDSHLYSIELDDGPVEDFRWRDLRPLLKG